MILFLAALALRTRLIDAKEEAISITVASKESKENFIFLNILELDYEF